MSAGIIAPFFLFLGTNESAMSEAATEEAVGVPGACCRALPSNTGIDDVNVRFRFGNLKEIWNYV
jgi:hypothetical protein